MTKSTGTAASAKPSIRIPSLVAIAASLEAAMDASRNFADAAVEPRDSDLALRSLLIACHNCIDSLAAIGGRASLEDLADAETAVRMDALLGELASKLPPVRGGGDPDDFEEVDKAFFEDSWPAYPHPELDGYAYETGPTPVEVLARSAPTWAPSGHDWDAYAALDVAGISEADHLVAHGCC